jgi:hypothetical protein
MAARHGRDSPSPSVVLIGVPHQKALERVIRKLEANRIEAVSFVEPDFDMGLSAVATVPLNAEQRLVLKNYETWKEKRNVIGA